MDYNNKDNEGFNNDMEYNYGGQQEYEMPQPDALRSEAIQMAAEAEKTVKSKKKIKAPKIPKERGTGKFKKYLFRGVAAVVSAVLLGGIAGGACYGISYLGYSIFPLNTSETNNSSNNNSGSGSVFQLASDQEDSDSNSNSSSVGGTTVYDVSDIVKQVITSVVAVEGTYTSSSMWGASSATVSGSGIIIGANDEELLIVTNAHVVENIDDNLSITLYDGTEISAAIKGIKSNNDIAIIAVNFSDIPNDAEYSIATLGDSSEVEVGEAAIAIGNAMGYGISVTTGCVSALNKTVTVDSVDYNNLIQTDAAINSGNSGGALFNANGEVIGINSVKMASTGVEGMGYAISITSVMDIIEELSLQETKIKLSEDERGYLGITGLSVTEEVASRYDYPVGVLIRSITENSASDNAGLIKNDIITSFDGTTVTTIDELVALMAYYAVGDEVEVVYYHMNNSGEYEEKTVTVTLTEKPKE